MSNSSSDLVVESAEPLSVVEIVDSRYRMITQSPRRAVAKLPPGLYVTRVKYTDHVEEKLVKHGSQPTTITFGLDLAEQTAARRQLASAQRSGVLKSVHSKGLRTWLTVSIKAPGMHSLSQDVRRQLPDWSSFAICELDGSVLTSQPFKSSDSADASFAEDERILSQELDVGWYALRMPSRDGRAVMIPLYVSERFSPTVLLEVGGVHEGQAWFDFSRLVVTYDELEGGAYDDTQRVAALRAARRSLELGRNGLTTELMDVLYRQKFRDPMLGFLALQLLLLRAPSKLAVNAPQVKQFNEVMSNTARLLDHPQHPDLVLARAQAQRLKWPILPMVGDDEPLVAPPLLRANWNALVTMSSRRQELIGLNRPLRRVSEGLLPTGIWVVWKLPSNFEHVLSADVGSEDLAGQFAGHLRDLHIQKTSRSKLTELADHPNLEITGANAPRPSRAIDAQLEVVVDQVRTQPGLQNVLQEKLRGDSGTSTVLDRTLARTVLQLAQSTGIGETSVANGFSKRMAKHLDVPFALVGETVQRLRKQIKSPNS